MTGLGRGSTLAAAAEAPALGSGNGPSPVRMETALCAGNRRCGFRERLANFHRQSPQLSRLRPSSGSNNAKLRQNKRFPMRTRNFSDIRRDTQMVSFPKD